MSAVVSRRGRPPLCPPEVLVRVLELRESGLSLAAISVALNDEGVPTPAGRERWTKSHVDRILHTRYAREWLAGRAGVEGQFVDLAVDVER